MEWPCEAGRRTTVQDEFMKAEVSGQRSRCSQKKIWMDAVQTDIKQLKLTDYITQDRSATGQ